MTRSQEYIPIFLHDFATSRLTEGQAPTKDATDDKPGPRDGTRKSSRQAEKRKAEDHKEKKPKKSVKAKK
jgi:hypothetical protein